MQLVNIILSMGLIILIIGITVLSAVTLEAVSNNLLSYRSTGHFTLLDRRKSDRRSNINCSFPLSCLDGTTIHFDRRRNIERRLNFLT